MLVHALLARPTRMSSPLAMVLSMIPNLIGLVIRQLLGVPALAKAQALGPSPTSPDPLCLSI